MPRLTRFAAVASLVLSLAACRSETTEIASVDTGATSSSTAAVSDTTVPQPATTPFIEPLPSEVPSILRRDQSTTNAAQTETNVVTDEWPPRMTVAEAKQLIDQGAAVMVDVRAPQYFQERHIPGSLNIPLADVALRANEIPEGKTAIAVCT